MVQDGSEPMQGGPEVPEEQPIGNEGEATSRPGEAWREVLVQIDALGDAVGAWTRAAINDPENRRHAAEIRGKLEAIASRVAGTIDDASKTDVGSAVVDGAEKTGRAIVDTSEKLADAAAPHVASALSGLAGVFGLAAERVGKAAERPAPAAPPVPEPADEAASESEHNASEDEPEL